MDVWLNLEVWLSNAAICRTDNFVVWVQPNKLVEVTLSCFCVDTLCDQTFLPKPYFHGQTHPIISDCSAFECFGTLLLINIFDDEIFLPKSKHFASLHSSVINHKRICCFQGKRSNKTRLANLWHKIAKKFYFMSTWTMCLT